MKIVITSRVQFELKVHNFNVWDRQLKRLVGETVSTFFYIFRSMNKVSIAKL